MQPATKPLDHEYVKTAHNTLKILHKLNLAGDNMGM
jgi:hypothetical protein